MKRLLLLLLFVPVMAFAWEPTRTVTVVIGNSPGAGNELAFRKLSQIINRTNKKITFVVENRAGADSVIAMNHLMTVTPDGHTIAAFNHMSLYVTQDIWQKNIKRYNYNSFEDVLTIGKSPLVLVAIATSAVNTPDEFATLLRTTQQPVFVAVGSGAHRITYEYLMMKTAGNCSLVKHVQFNGPAQALNSVASTAGGTEFGIMPLAIARPLIEAGKVKPIGITGGEDHPVRNQIEHELVNSMLSRDLPIIGVCHGCQLLTQRLNGSVVPVDDHQDCYHEVFYRDQPHLVNSYHNLRIERSPPGATVLACDPDGYPEAWIQERTAGVMWHPERMIKSWIPQEIQLLLTR